MNRCRKRIGHWAWILSLVLLPSCVETASAPRRAPDEARRPPQEARRPARRIDPRQAERLQRVMVPLLRAMDKPRPPNQVRIGIVDDSNINAANAGGGEFYITTGLLEKASDEQLSHMEGGKAAKAAREKKKTIARDK